jgi:hypothetical protein
MEAWRIAQRLDSRRNDDFGGWLQAGLHKRTVDWYRQNFYDARHGDPEARAAVRFAFSLDAPAGDGDAGTLGELVAVSDGLDAADRDAVVGRLRRERDRERARDLRQLRGGVYAAGSAGTRAGR